MTSRLFVLRDMADDIVTRSHEFLARPNSRPLQSMNRLNVEYKFTSRRARLVSVTLYFLSVTIAAVVLGCFYMFYWRPGTDRLYGRTNHH
ncbi:hypothetical protein DPMN_090554 [Dreissena polymorpha]|uniref:Uncharacterized protein n=1 Tax=Dreissena polymorpha TaxID=45954 RepID=A0A9D4KYA1_DREPO|nr:hypothetical protein DPMN_090554 [Dreissena polymorpha]